MALLIAAALVAACECEPAAPEQLIEQADAIFRGTLSNLSENVEGCGETGTWNYSILVTAVYKGEVVERVNVQSEQPDADACGMGVEREGEFLVYAKKLENFREYFSSSCMGTKSVAEAEADLALLGPGEAPGDVGCLAVRAEWALLVVALMAGTGRRYWLRARSRLP
jgi:hypothetical protein